MLQDLHGRLQRIASAIERVEDNLIRYKEIPNSQAVDGERDGILVDRAGKIVSVGADVVQLTGYEASELAGSSLASIISPRTAGAARAYLNGTSPDGAKAKPHRLPVTLRHASGFEVPVDLVPTGPGFAGGGNGPNGFASATPQSRRLNGSAATDAQAAHSNGSGRRYDDDRSVRSTQSQWSIRYLVLDRSGRRQLEDELDRLRADFRTFADTVTEAIIQINHDFRILFVNNAVRHIFGYQQNELTRQSVDVLFPVSRRARYRRSIEKYFFIDDVHREHTGLSNAVELLGLRRNGDVFPLEISLGNSKGQGDQRVLTCILRDITVRKKDERRLKFLAYHDQLTSLGNRDMLEVSLAQLFAEIQRAPERQGALLFLDLDGFKKVNDSLGHHMGDTILRETARRLSNCVRENDQVYRFGMRDIFRLGGDEFTILLPVINKPEDAAVVAARVIDQMRDAFRIEGFGAISHVSMGVSIGIALIPDDGMDKDTLLRNADAAMYTAKELGNNYAFFKKEMNNKAVERLFLEDGLRKSLRNQDFELYYQPVCDRFGMPLGVEALVRWIHPERGPILPSQFIPVAEDNRMILEIGRWVLERAALHARHWQAMGVERLFVSVNISPKQLEHDHLSRVVGDVIASAGLPPDTLILELTETTIMRDPEYVIVQMQDLLRNHPGLQIAVDDFGTGYSSLSYLSRFPVTTLKIDKSFVTELHKENNTKIVNTILSLSKSLGLRVVAEGVESEQHVRYLVERECDAFQGYHFSPPLSFSDTTAYLTKRLLRHEPRRVV